MFGVEAEWRVLSAGFDELNLWDLPGRHVYVRFGRNTVTPDLGLPEVREALAQALARGHVELYDADASGYPRVPLAEALELIGDESEWSAETASRHVALTTTEAGARASNRIFARLRTASPFKAAGATDPQVFDEDG